MFLNGHIYMTWSDDKATWDPSLFNNVRTTMISRRSHATLTSITPNKTKVESYPTFSVRVGCNFNFRDYPNDEQNCAARLYTTNVMSEVELAIYYNLEPSVMLGWGNQSIKKNIQEWELLSVNANLSFYKSHRKYSNERPNSAYEAQSTWTLIILNLKFRRNSPQYWLGIGLPCFVCLIIILLSFLSTKIELSIGLLLANFVLESVLLRDALQTLPPAAGENPKIVTFAQFLLITTLVSLIIQIFTKCLVQKAIKYSSFLQKLLIISETNNLFTTKFKKNLEPELIFRLYFLFILFLICIPFIFIYLF
ncbi:unnamed protein product [Meloidogyne enterolobii]|uniref:Uncharacterized protein n=1 Tax=Meloidogyne enterolobii TaxID=390850 RepID=A0ACB0YT22_MELEN